MIALKQSEQAPYRRDPPPTRFGPNRAAAYLEAGDGFCCACDLPIPLRTDGKRRGVFTCGKRVCKMQWGELCTKDMAERRWGTP